MKPFVYERARDVASAVQAAFAPEVVFLGGGTNLIDLMKLGVAQPTRLIDVSRLPLDRVDDLADGGLSIGATVRNSDLAAHPAVRERYPVLVQALLGGASGQIRNVATVAGNLLQRTRCPYFQDTSKPCNKRRPGSSCPAREGEHSNLAILGHSQHCVATHPSDMAVALAALDARVRTNGPDRGRTIPINDLYRFPGEEPERDTTLKHGELIASVELEPPLEHARSRYHKARERASFAFALVSVAVVARACDGLIEDCRIALGGVAHGPWRAHKAEAVLRGQPATEASFARAARAELAAAEPLKHNGFKVPLARNLIVRALSEVGQS